jgi:hypothetical protein
MNMVDRPLGVAVICILQFIGAIILIALGAVVGIVGVTLIPGWPGYGALAATLGLGVLVLGIVMFIVTFGLWQLKAWALWLTIILNIISIILSILGGALPGIIIPLIVLIYLLVVRDHFR